MPSIGFPELVLILVIALIVFGPGKLPSVGSAIGKALNEFKKAARELTQEDGRPATTTTVHSAAPQNPEGHDPNQS